MARKTTRARVGRERAPQYARVGGDFFEAASLALEHDYASAAALLYIHAAIALADAVAIHLSGFKSTSDQHQDAVALLRQIAEPSGGRDAAVRHLKRLIDEKSRIAYTGEVVTRKQVDGLAIHAERFRTWAVGILPVGGA